jgi:ribosomal protein L11 methyltransferase
VSTRFQRLVVEVVGSDLAEQASAEAFAAGATGLEEREGREGRTELILYAPADAAPDLEAALGAWAAGRPNAAAVGPLEDLETVDWSRRWQEGLEAVSISERLAIRPSFVPADSVAAAHTLVVDPGQAFGTGGHASTRLALLELDALPPDALRGRSVLDVGTGTGVLALAALALGARFALGVDTDSLATQAARANAVVNRLAANARFVTGSLACLSGARFDLVLANLLRTELLPLLPEIARALAPRGCAIFSGLLEREREEVERAIEAVGLGVASTRTTADDTDRWLAMLTKPR